MVLEIAEEGWAVIQREELHSVVARVTSDRIGRIIAVD
jgi:hypothetical protein